MDNGTLILILTIVVAILAFGLGYFVACRTSEVKYQNAIARIINKCDIEDEEDLEGVQAFEIDPDELPDDLKEILHIDDKEHKD